MAQTDCFYVEIWVWRLPFTLDLVHAWVLVAFLYLLPVYSLKLFLELYDWIGRQISGDLTAPHLTSTELGRPSPDIVTEINFHMWLEIARKASRHSRGPWKSCHLRAALPLVSDTSSIDWHNCFMTYSNNTLICQESIPGMRNGPVSNATYQNLPILFD